MAANSTSGSSGTSAYVSGSPYPKRTRVRTDFLGDYAEDEDVRQYVKGSEEERSSEEEEGSEEEESSEEGEGSEEEGEQERENKKGVLAAVWPLMFPETPVPDLNWAVMSRRCTWTNKHLPYFCMAPVLAVVKRHNSISFQGLEFNGRREPVTTPLQEKEAFSMMEECGRFVFRTDHVDHSRGSVRHANVVVRVEDVWYLVEPHGKPYNKNLRALQKLGPLSSSLQALQLPFPLQKFRNFNVRVKGASSRDCQYWAGFFGIVATSGWNMQTTLERIERVNAANEELGLLVLRAAVLYKHLDGKCIERLFEPRKGPSEKSVKLGTKVDQLRNSARLLDLTLKVHDSVHFQSVAAINCEKSTSSVEVHLVLPHASGGRLDMVGLTLADVAFQKNRQGDYVTDSSFQDLVPIDVSDARKGVLAMLRGHAGPVDFVWTDNYGELQDPRLGICLERGATFENMPAFRSPTFFYTTEFPPSRKHPYLSYRLHRTSSCRLQRSPHLPTVTVFSLPEALDLDELCSGSIVCRKVLGVTVTVENSHSELSLPEGLRTRPAYLTPGDGQRLDHTYAEVLRSGKSVTVLPTDESSPHIPFVVCWLCRRNAPYRVTDTSDEAVDRAIASFCGEEGEESDKARYMWSVVAHALGKERMAKYVARTLLPTKTSQVSFVNSAHQLVNKIASVFKKAELNTIYRNNVRGSGAKKQKTA